MTKTVEAYTVLYIEDNADNLLLVQKILEKRQKIKFIDAMDADRGLEMAFKYQPNLILLDINLPGKDGFAILEELRADIRTKTIPVVGLSANACQEDIAKGLSAGFAEYITKPIDVPLFLEKIDAFLGFNS